jgi:hypothetical protein
VRKEGLLRAVLQAGAFAFLTVSLVRVAAVWIYTSAEDAASDMTTWLSLSLAVGAVYGAVVLALAPRIARAAGEGTATETDLRRVVERVAGLWCLGAALQGAMGFVQRPDLDASAYAFVPEWGAGLKVPLHAALAVLLLVGPGRIGRWMRETFGPIPTRD